MYITHIRQWVHPKDHYHLQFSLEPVKVVLNAHSYTLETSLAIAGCDNDNNKGFKIYKISCTCPFKVSLTTIK
jgi:hypothetical protein